MTYASADKGFRLDMLFCHTVAVKPFPSQSTQSLSQQNDGEDVQRQDDADAQVRKHERGLNMSDAAGGDHCNEDGLRKP